MNKLKDLMKILPDSLDGALITSPINRLYYTQFTSSAGTLVVTKEESYLIIDGRYFEAAQQAITACKVILQDKPFEQIKQLLKKHKVKNLGVESDTLTVSQLREIENKLTDFTVVSDPTLSQIIREQRSIKSAKEQEYLQLSQDITDKTFEYILPRIEAGRTEIEIMLDMELFSRRQGSEGAAFSFIIAAGPNSSQPHAVPSDYVVKKGDFVLLDYGSVYKGYRSDMTRTVVVGNPSALQEEVYYTVLGAQKAAMEVIKAGVSLKAVHQVAADFIDASPFKGKFTHGLGHSLGLDIHETPNFNDAETEVAKIGHVMTVEPGIYLAGEMGVRIEDFICITETGFYNFTGSLKEELIVL